MKLLFTILFMFLVVNANASYQGDDLLDVSLEYDQKEKVLTVYLENKSQMDIVLSRCTEVNENGSSLRVKLTSDAKNISPNAISFPFSNRALPMTKAFGDCTTLTPSIFTPILCRTGNI